MYNNQQYDFCKTSSIVDTWFWKKCIIENNLIIAGMVKVLQ
jgi:hypothetical protein